MATWVDDIASLLTIDSENIVRAREGGAAARIVTWMILNIPPEWIVVFSLVGFCWFIAVLMGLAFFSTRVCVDRVFAYTSDVIQVVDTVYTRWYAELHPRRPLKQLRSTQ